MERIEERDTSDSEDMRTLAAAYLAAEEQGSVQEFIDEMNWRLRACELSDLVIQEIIEEIVMTADKLSKGEI
jgi:hypothetical protein